MAKAFALFSVPSPHETHLYKRNFISRNSWEIVSYPAIKLNAPLCSPSSTTVVEDGPSSPDSLPIQSDSAADYAVEIPQSGCRACGREEIEKGCNGEGRIQGGIATVPGFGWWPIKAYRPCPGFVASGGRYRRQGQSMDEVVSGGAAKASLRSGSDKKSSDKKEGARKSKRYRAQDMVGRRALRSRLRPVGPDPCRLQEVNLFGGDMHVLVPLSRRPTKKSLSPCSRPRDNGA